MPRTARLLLAALALVALSPAAARAEETSSRATEAERARKGRHHHHHRRAKNDEPVARAPRGGAAPVDKHARARKPPAERAESIGSPNDGHLKGGVHIDVSKPYLRVHGDAGDIRWGLPIMINMIERAARNVNKRFPGAVLDVGDISQKGGGDLLRHHSHESGRDADLGFYAVDARGKQIHGRMFVKFNPDLTSPSHPGARFDLPRNWAFVQELLTDPAARVSHVFIAEWLRRELLTYARTHATRAVQDRAALVLMQPHNSLPHDDHIHVRISCPREAHSQCIELARSAPHGRARVAHKTHAGGHPLRTPHGHAGPRHHPAKTPPPAAATAPLDPFALPPIVAPDDSEPDTDGKELLDESGSVKLTD